MRNEFTDVYQKSFGFYDRDMIAYQLLNGRKDKIRDYLNLFRKYPDDDPDNLFKVIELLMANNCQEILAEFVFDIYVKVCTSPDILGGEEILDQVVWSHFIPYLKPDFTADDMRQLATQLKTIEIPIDDKYCQHEFLQKKFKFIFGDFTNWQINDCKKKHAIYERYDETTLNFMGFLHTRKNKDWMAAEFLRRMVFSYLVECIPKGKRPKEAFEFTKQKIDEKIAKICQDLFFLDTVKTFGTLNGIYYFAEYLEETQTIGVEEKDQIQNWCSELFNQVYSHMVKQSFAAKVFEKFPF
jgi:hypothetical protein